MAASPGDVKVTLNIVEVLGTSETLPMGEVRTTGVYVEVLATAPIVLVMGTVSLQWEDNNDVEAGHRVYRSENPIDPNNLPTPIADLGVDVVQYDDHGEFKQDHPYYYRVGAYKGDDEKISEEIEVLIG